MAYYKQKVKEKCQLNKIKDRFTLSLLAGGIGGTLAMIVDAISALLRISQRSWRVTAAGVLVSNRKQAETLQGQILGTLMTVTLSIIGAFGFISLLTKYGRDNLIAKGLLFGMAFGNIINTMLGGFVENKVRPKDAASNLSYLFSSAIFGTATALVATKMGHDSIYDASPKNDWLNPTEKTTEEMKLQKTNAAR